VFAEKLPKTVDVHFHGIRVNAITASVDLSGEGVAANGAGACVNQRGEKPMLHRRHADRRSLQEELMMNGIVA
jgi:hypothetical protein